MTFSQARTASRFDLVDQIAERTFIVFRILAAVETFQGRKDLLTKLFDAALAFSQ
jgi:hypothetical protein